MRKEIWSQIFAAVVMIIRQSTGTTVFYDQCNGPDAVDIRLERYQSVQFDASSNKTSQGRVTDCVIDMRTLQGWRIVLNVDYHPGTPFASGSKSCSYSPFYLMVGNDYTAIGSELMTSYKYCREVSGAEIVSRDQHLWMVMKDASAYPSRLRFTARSLPEVSCEDYEMQCSPVQCVHRSFVCDGKPDCSNGLDEYCYRLANVSTTQKNTEDVIRTNPSDALKETLQSKSSESSKENNKTNQQIFNFENFQLPRNGSDLPPQDSACFLCRDGTCILPRVERYDWRWGTWLWYLCDGISHCPDGWDEHGYMCSFFKHYPERLEKDLFQCEAYDLPLAVSRQVRMWSLAKCDKRRDCRKEDVEGEDKCGDLLKDPESHLYMDGRALGSVLAFVLIVIFCALLVLRKLGRRRRDNDDRRHLHPNIPQQAELRTCVQTKPICKGPQFQAPTTANKSLPATVADAVGLLDRNELKDAEQALLSAQTALSQTAIEEHNREAEAETFVFITTDDDNNETRV